MQVHENGNATVQPRTTGRIARLRAEADQRKLLSTPKDSVRLGKEPDRYWMQSGRILRALGLSHQDHVLMRENLAAVLSQYGESFLKELEQTPRDELLEKLRGIKTDLQTPWYWQYKIDRDIKNPYTDKEVFDYLPILQRNLQDGVQHIIWTNNELFPTRTVGIYLVGSFVKGRFARQSDLDILVEGKAPRWDEMRNWKRVNRHQRMVNLDADFLPDDFRLRDYHLGQCSRWGPIRKIDLDDIFKEGAFRPIYVQALARRGFSVIESQEFGLKIERVRVKTKRVRTDDY